MSKDVSQDYTMTTIESLEQYSSEYRRKSLRYRGKATFYSLVTLATGYEFVNLLTDSPNSRDMSKYAVYGLATFCFGWGANIYQGKANTAELSAANINAQIASLQAGQA